MSDTETTQRLPTDLTSFPHNTSRTGGIQQQSHSYQNSIYNQKPQKDIASMRVRTNSVQEQRKSTTSIADQQTIPSPSVSISRNITQTPASSIETQQFAFPTTSAGISSIEVTNNSTKYVGSKKKRLLGIVAVGCVLVLLLSIGAFYVRHKLTTVPDVTLYRASMQTVEQDIGAGGVVFPNQRLDISYPFESRVTSVLVKPGDHVALNQPLIQLDFSQVNSKNLLQLNTQVQQAYQDMLNAQSYLNSVTVVGNPVIIAQAQQQYIAAQNKYNSLAAEAAAPSLHQGVLVSAFAGTITTVNVYPGQVFGANRVMLTVYDESSVIIHIMVPLSNLKQIYVGQAAQVTPSALPNSNYAGKVISIIRDSDPQTDTIQAWVSVKNPNGDFVTGMSTFVQLKNSVKALVLPRLAVLNPDRDSIVYVVRSQHAHIQHVEVVGYAGDSILIASGLSVNDMVVLVGLDSLQDGQAVNVTSIENQAN